MSNPETHADDVKKLLAMTADTVGRDLLQALVQEIKLLPDVWPKLSQTKQDDVINRLRSRVDTNVKMAVHLIASEDRVVVTGELDQITIKDGVKAVVKFGMHAPGLVDLYEASGQAVLVVVANHRNHTGGMDDVRGESDQRAMDLGHEYDPDSDGKGMGDDDAGVVDAAVKAISLTPLQAELDEAYGDGKLAAQEGKPREDCPVMKGALCIEWVKGWKSWHRENNSEWWQAHGDLDELADEGQAA